MRRWNEIKNEASPWRGFLYRCVAFRDGTLPGEVFLIGCRVLLPPLLIKAILKPGEENGGKARQNSAPPAHTCIGDTGGLQKMNGCHMNE